MNKYNDTSEHKVDNHYIRVITFNLLTQKYSVQSYYHTVKEEYLNFESRSERVYQLLESWAKVNFIICLQEIDTGWNEILEKYFAQLNYVYIPDLYFDGRMGVAIAYPANHYDFLDQYIYRPSQIVNERYNKMKDMLEKEEDMKHTVVKYEPSELHKLANGKLREEMAAAGDQYYVQNVLLSIVLRVNHYGKDTGKRIIVSTYHMPCCYTKRYYMISHIYAVKYLLKILYQNWREKYHINSLIFMGDFNIVPLMPEYKMLTNQKYNINDNLEFINRISQVYNEIGYDINNTINVKSSHMVHHGKEPDYTNVCIQKEKKFVDCLDYILITDDVEVKSCMVGLTVPDPYLSGYPNGLCPSDHVPLSASLGIK